MSSSSGRGGDHDGNGTNSEHGSSSNSSSNGEGLGGGGNNSDNSNLVSLGNTSFGFNFDSEDGSGSGGNSTSPQNGEGPGSSGSSEEEGDSSSSSGNNDNDNSSDQDDGNNTGIGGGIDTDIDGKDGPVKETDDGDDDDDGPVTKQPKTTGGERPESSSRIARGKPAEVTSSSSDSNNNEKAYQHHHSSMSSDASQQHQQQPTVKKSNSNSDSSNTTVDPASSSNSSNGEGEQQSSDSGSPTYDSPTAADAAEATAHLKAIAAASIKAAEMAAAAQESLKRKSPEPSVENDSGGYNSDEDDEARTRSEISAFDSACVRGSLNNNNSGGGGGGTSSSTKKKKKLDDMKREERNAREKERSFRISVQINELRNLLSSGGVIVPKGTKSSVLTEAANYIRMLQQHQYRSEIDRHQLVQQIQMIGGGALGQQAATAVRHVAAQNGVWSLGNFGGVPPKSAMMYHSPGSDMSQPEEVSSQSDGSILPNKIIESDYRHVFNSCGVGMAIASMGGAFIDCNRLFSQLSNYSKQEVCSMTVFNMTSRQDLQSAFDLISQMLSAPTESESISSSSCVLRGSFKHRADLGICVSLVKGEDGVAKCFCVTLIMNPSSPFDSRPPIPATIDLISNVSTTGSFASTKDQTQSAIEASSQPAYTTG